MATPAALITGGTSGIGLATARLLHERGYGVIVTGSSEASVAKAAEQLPSDVLVRQADARSLADTDRVVTEARERFGELTGLFLNAGIARSVAIDALDEATFDDVFAVNTKGQVFTLVKALPLLADGASVVITLGTGVIRGRAGAAVTAASRGALLTMVPSLALELAPRGIRVNAVSPGAVDTPIWAKTGASQEAVSSMMTSLKDRIPLGRLGEPDDIAESVAFLMSDAARYITGQNLVVGGGLEL